MPRKTSRWIQLSGLRHLRSLQILTDGVDERFDKPLMQPQDLNPWMLDDDEMFYEDYGLQELIELASVVEHTRYNHRPKYSPAPSAALAERVISDRVIESWCHMHRRSFDFIFSLIRDHPIFCQKEGRPQVSLKLQLAAALARFCGKGTTIAQFATKFKVSHGSMIKYCSRVSEALLTVERKFLRWPNAARRVRLRNHGFSEFGFSGYIGNIDGTHFYLCQAPVFDCYPECYYDTMHSGGYGYNVILITDHTGSIIHYMLGWPGSVHDATIQQRAALLTRNATKAFSPGEYLFGDCGFARTPTCVCPYKEPAASQPINSRFNHAMRQGRCRIEHVNAVLKSRFKSLKSVPVLICKPEDHHKANVWIRTCLVLHNILLRLKDEWEFDDNDDEEQHVEEEERIADDGDDVSGAEFQQMVRDNWLEYASRV